jgi:hypothetical protein
LLGDPLVIVSGVTDREAKAVSEAEAIRGAVVALNCLTIASFLESESRNTREEAMVRERILTERGIDRFVVVTSPIHMGRSLAALAIEGRYPVPSASPPYQGRSAAPFPLTPNDASPRSDTPSYTNGARAPIRGGAAGFEPRRGR